MLSVFFVCIGCSSKGEAIQDVLHIEQAQQIDITLADGPESVWKVLDDTEDIQSFVEKLQVDKWQLAELPHSLLPENMFELYQANTVKLGEVQADKKELEKVGTIISYEDSRYIEFQMKKLTVHFKVPKEVATFLSQGSTE